MKMKWRFLVASSVFAIATGCSSSGQSLLSWNRSYNDPSLYQNEESAVEKLQLPARDGAKACIATAEVMNQSEKYKEAAALYERARAIDPEHALVCRKLAVAYDRQGMFAKADEEYDKAVAANPKDAELWNDRGYSHYSRGNWGVSEEYFRKSLELKPENKRAWTNLGLTLAQLGRTEEAIGAFEHSVPTAQAYCNVAFVLAAQGKKSEAIVHYKRASELAPDLQLARTAVEKLQTVRAQKPPADEKTVDAKSTPAPATAEREIDLSDDR
jgi:tetratricopeptide (TPR) repeat protein